MNSLRQSDAMRTTTILLASLLSGCAGLRHHDAPVGDANPQCYVACAASDTDTGIRWIANPESPAAWDDLGGRILPELSGKVLTCDRNRRACVDFIRDLKKKKVIR